MSSGKLFQTAAGAASEKARSAKARLVRPSCSRFIPQDRSWRDAARNIMKSYHIVYNTILQCARKPAGVALSIPHSRILPNVS